MTQQQMANQDKYIVESTHHNVTHTLTRSQKGATEDDTGRGTPIVATAYSFDSLSSNSMKSANPISGCNKVEVAKCLDTTNPEPSKNQGGIAVVQSATAWKIRGGSEVETGEQGGTPGKKAEKRYLGSDKLAFTVASTQDQNIYCYENHANDSRIKPLEEGIAPTVSSRWGTGGNNQALVQAVAFEPGSIARNAGPSGEEPVCPTLRSNMGDNQPATRQAMQVRRLTPLECERLQGFPDGWTRIPWRKKSAEDCPDGPRYKAIGNSFAVNVVQYIGIKIQMVQELMDEYGSD